MLRRTVLASALTTAALVFAGCTSSGPAEQSAGPSAAELLAAARKTFDAASSVSIVLTSEGVPAGVSGVTGTTGKAVISATEPKFDGQVTGTFGGVTGNIAVRAIGEKVWAKLFTETFEPFDLASVGAPNPARFFDPAHGLSALLTDTQKPALGEWARVDKDVVRQVSGTLSGARVKELLVLGEDTATFSVTYGITESSHVLRTVSLTGPFYGTATSTYDIVLADYGVPVEISAP